MEGLPSETRAGHAQPLEQLIRCRLAITDSCSLSCFQLLSGTKSCRSASLIPSEMPLQKLGPGGCYQPLYSLCLTKTGEHKGNRTHRYLFTRSCPGISSLCSLRGHQGASGGQNVRATFFHQMTSFEVSHMKYNLPKS